MNALDRIQENLRRLKLHRMVEILETRLEEAAQNNRCYTDFLDELLSEEVSAKREKNLSMRTTMARFPLREDPGEFRLRFPAVGGEEAHSGTGRVPVHRQWRERGPAGSARGGQDPPGRGLGPGIPFTN